MALPHEHHKPSKALHMRARISYRFVLACTSECSDRGASKDKLLWCPKLSAICVQVREEDDSQHLQFCHHRKGYPT